jgi:hypothetical protein
MPALDYGRHDERVMELSMFEYASDMAQDSTTPALYIVPYKK